MRWLYRLLRWAATAVAAAIVLLALGVGLFRLLVPQLPTYQDELETWATEATGVPFEVGRMDARWGLRGPELTLHDVRFGESGAEPVTTARRAAVGISLRDLLLERRIQVDRLAVVGASVRVTRTPDGGLAIQGRPLLPGGDTGGVLPAVPALAIELEDCDVVYVAGGVEWRFAGIDGTLARGEDGALLRLAAELPARLGSTVEVEAAAVLPEGEPEPLDELAWRLSVGGEDLALDGWATLLDGLGTPLPQAGTADLALEAEAAGSALEQVVVELAARDVVLPGDATPYAVLAGRFDWARGAAGWRAGAERLEVTRAGRAWTSATVAVTREASGTGEAITAAAERLVLEDLTPFAVWLRDASLRERLARARPAGELTGLELELRPGDAEPLKTLRARVRGLGMAAHDGLPGLRGLDAAVDAGPESGELGLESRALSLELPEVFPAPLPPVAADGRVRWTRSDGGIELTGDALTVAGDFGRAEAAFAWRGTETGAAIELAVEAPGLDLPALQPYVPTGRLPPLLGRWLKRAFPAGRLENVDMVLRGPLDRFPYDEGDGRFLITADFDGLTLDYADRWPVITDLAGQVRFEGRRLEGAVSSGVIQGGRVLQGRAEIANLRRPDLRVVAQSQNTVPQLIEFLRTSPVRDRLGDIVDRLEGDGRGVVRLELDLPLLRLRESRWRGTVDLANAELGLAPLAQRLTDLSGQIYLDQGAVRGEGLRGRLFDEPFEALLRPASGNGYHTEVLARGSTRAPQLVDGLDLPLGERLAGVLAWNTRVLVPDRGDDAPPLRIVVSSDLEGLAVDLPPPLAKTTELARPSLLDVGLGGDDVEVSGYVGTELRWRLDLDRGDAGVRLERGTFAAGGLPAELADQPGLRAVGRVPVLRLGDWFDLAFGNGPAGGGFAELRRVDVTAGELLAYGQRLADARLVLERRPDAWQAEIASEAVAGRVLVPVPLGGERPVELDMDRLLLVGGDERTGRRPDPRAVPAMRVRAREFGLGSMRLGALDAELLDAADGVVVPAFVLSGPEFAVRGEGAWIETDVGQQTRLALSFDSTDVETSLARLGYAPILAAADGRMVADVRWRGSPLERWQPTVSGSVSISVRDGELREIDPGAGRVAGLLSVGALPRRLALDFRDVFAEGLSFDSVTGGFELIDGDAYTDDLRLKGPVVDIGIVGRTGLARRDYAQQAVLSADVGLALPAVGGLLAGPGVGAAILLFQQLFKEPLRGMTQAAYCVSGSWEAPEVDRLTQADVQAGRLCADLPPGWKASVAEGVEDDD